jgi:hypothetical protein
VTTINTLTAEEEAVVKTLTPTQAYEIFGALEKFFDSERKLYVNGMSDRKIADTLGIAPAAVKGLRIKTKAFGALAISSEALALTEDLTAMTQLLTTVRDEFEGKLKDLEKDIEEMKARLKRISVA